jgi:hypothetical protein
MAFEGIDGEVVDDAGAREQKRSIWVPVPVPVHTLCSMSRVPETRQYDRPGRHPHGTGGLRTTMVMMMTLLLLLLLLLLCWNNIRSRLRLAGHGTRGEIGAAASCCRPFGRRVIPRVGRAVPRSASTSKSTSTSTSKDRSELSGAEDGYVRFVN